jgi:RNA recognition motif-containing protein
MNIHVANLSLNIIERDLDKLFAAYGQVGFVVIVRDKVNGRSMGSAFIEMPQQAEGEQAILALDQMEIDGQEISVREVKYKAGEFNN